VRRNWLSRRWILLLALVLLAGLLLALSYLGFLSPLENLVATPLNFIVGFINDATDPFTSTSDEAATIEELEARNAELERQLAEIQGELVTLREVAADYERLTDLLEYTNSTTDREYVTADVIGEGQYGFIRSIIINKGTRDGLIVGMPVVTDLGLVGRVWRVTANNSQVQLITDRNSFVSGRLQSSRAEGTIQGRGLETGSLSLRFIPPDAEVLAGDLVYTSGLGGNFPADIPIGQVISVTNIESDLSQEAQVSSLIDFSRLEQVLVITNFEPADLSVFEEAEP
jgi:rod shape-determining protein MreC